MWYAAQRPRTLESKPEKTLREARQTIRWTPCFAVVVLVTILLGGSRFAGHPDVENALNLALPLGATLVCVSRWKKAQATLAGTKDGLPGMAGLLGLMLMALGSFLRDLWHHKEMSLFALFGILSLAVTLSFLALMVWEVAGRWQARRQS